MAVTVAPSPANFITSPSGVQSLPTSIANRKVGFVSIALDASYPTGGYTVDPSLFSMNFITFIQAPATPDGSGRYLQWNLNTRKLQAFTNAGAEVANATNLAAVTLPVVVVGS